MFISTLEKIGVGKFIDLSDAGLDDLKVVGFLIICLTTFVSIFVIPWLYGFLQISLKIFNWII